MARWLKYSIVPAVAAFAALFSVLPQTGADRVVAMVGSPDAWTFDPARVEVAAGSRVAFRNDSRVTHTATCSGCPWDTGDVQPGQTIMVEFPEALAFPFLCRYHGQAGMRGEVRVGGAVPQPGPPGGAPPPGTVP